METNKRQTMIDRKKYNQEYYKANKKNIIGNVMDWKENNPEKVKNYIKNANNSPKERIRREKWVENNVEKNKQLKSKWAKENKELRKKNQKGYAKRHPEKIKAQYMAQKIPLKKECGICKTTESLERHHWRYDKPLLVSTLCKDCHTIQHIKHFGGDYNRRG